GPSQLLALRGVGDLGDRLHIGPGDERLLRRGDDETLDAALPREPVELLLELRHGVLTEQVHGRIRKIEDQIHQSLRIGSVPGGAHELLVQAASTSRAAPCPPPTHSVARPRASLRLDSSHSKVRIRRPPVAPTGWPRAIAPPFTLVRSGSSSPSALC